MIKLLTDEEKQYLRRTCNYLGSMGMKSGEIHFELDYNDPYLDYDSINWKSMRNFSNNYSVEVPSGLIDILKKIVKYASDEMLYSPNTSNVDDLNWQSYEILIDCRSKEICLLHYWSWYNRGDESSETWDGEDGLEIFERWEQSGVLKDLEIPNDGILTLSYNGSGDSGHLESDFNENAESVPTVIEDWCYNKLEYLHGGWEINEGSDGQFIFDFKNHEITLNHAYNTEENSSDTLWEESFKKDEE